MNLNTITVADFKAQFFRDFPYLPVYSATQLYNIGAVVYFTSTELFYTALLDALLNVPPTPPTDPASWLRNVVQPSVDDYVLDEDIEHAFAEAQMNFNQALFGTDAEIKLGYLYLTAFYLCNDLRASRAGIMAAGMYPLSSRSVGNVSESYGIPAAYMDDPLFAFYSLSAYGMKYLAMVIPKLRGNVGVVAGMTLP